MLAADSFQVHEVPRSVKLRSPSARPTQPQPGARKVRVNGLAVFLLLLVAPTVWGQITVPAENPRDKIIDVVVNLPGVPADAQLLGALRIDGADWRPGYTKGLYHVTAKPGNYAVVAEGWWITTRMVKLPDEPEPVQVITGMGQYSQSAIFKVVDAGPPPPVNPYKPAPAFQAAAEPVRKLSLSQADSRALAGLYSSVASQVRAGAYQSLGQIRSDLVKRGTALNLKGKYAPLSSTVDTYLTSCLGLEEAVPAASVGDVFETLAWAVFEAGKGG